MEGLGSDTAASVSQDIWGFGSMLAVRGRKEVLLDSSLASLIPGQALQHHFLLPGSGTAFRSWANGSLW